jgi:hypothetical protein
MPASLGAGAPALGSGAPAPAEGCAGWPALDVPASWLALTVGAGAAAPEVGGGAALPLLAAGAGASGSLAVSTGGRLQPASKLARSAHRAAVHRATCAHRSLRSAVARVTRDEHGTQGYGCLGRTLGDPLAWVDG